MVLIITCSLSFSTTNETSVIELSSSLAALGLRLLLPAKKIEYILVTANNNMLGINWSDSVKYLLQYLPKVIVVVGLGELLSQRISIPFPAAVGESEDFFNLPFKNI